MLLAVYILVVLLVKTSYTSSANQGKYNCSLQKNVAISIGVIINRSTRVGKEQELAMKIAAQDIYRDCCIQLTLHFRDSFESSNSATSTALKLMHKNKVQAIIGTFSLPEAAVLSEIHKNFLNIPVIFLPPTASLSTSLPIPSSNLIRMSSNSSIDIQCLTSIVSYFQWRKLTVIYERSNSFSLDSGIISVLSDSLKSVNSTVEQHLSFPPINTLSDPDSVIEQEFRKLNLRKPRVFIVLQSSLKLATSVFRKAHQMGLIEKGFVWIISDEIAGLLDSVDTSVFAFMQGVIGYKTSFIDTSKSYKKFKIRFERNYLNKYPNDQGNPIPSIFALRAYDALQAIVKAKNISSLRNLHSNMLECEFVGLSGNISFKHGVIDQLPTYKIINVVGNGYRDLAIWSAEYSRKNHQINIVRLGPIYWPGSEQTVYSRGLMSPGIISKKPLRIGVPASGAFHSFVNVSNDEVLNRTYVTGFAVDVFRASLKYLPYDLNFNLVPFYGSYDELVHQIHHKGFDAAVGDINILEERYKWADFSQPYVKSGMVMVVAVKNDSSTNEMWMFLKVFDSKMWILLPFMGLFMGFVVCLIEHVDDPEFGDASFFQQVGTIFWFSLSLLLFAQNESPRSNLSKIVLAPWHFLVLMLTIYFTAALTSLMTVSQLPPSVKDVDTLRTENAGVGCNWNSFLCPYLVDVLQLKSNNIRPKRSMEEYHTAFQRGEIKAAFFVTLHAQVFLAKYCKDYTIAGPTYYFGGLSFAFPKGSSLSIDMSQAMLKAMEKGEIEMLERELLAHYKCSTSSTNNTSTNTNTNTSVGLKPFSGLFYISGGIASIALLFIVILTVEKRLRISRLVHEIVTIHFRKLFVWMSMIFIRT